MDLLLKRKYLFGMSIIQVIWILIISSSFYFYSEFLSNYFVSTIIIYILGIFILSHMTTCHMDKLKLKTQFKVYNFGDEAYCDTCEKWYKNKDDVYAPKCPICGRKNMTLQR